MVISPGKNQISADSEIIQVSGNVVISKESDEIWYDFGGGICPRFNLDKSACFITISIVLLVDANPWSGIGKNHSASVTSEFAD